MNSVSLIRTKMYKKACVIIVVNSTFQGPVLWQGPSLSVTVDKGLIHFDWILVD